MSELLRRELWSSWAGVLRSYAAVHSLGRECHAVVEVGEHEILLRYGVRVASFRQDAIKYPDGRRSSFSLMENGDVVVDGEEEAMDLAAERLAREIIAV